ncbi:MAG TPA: hypothetical protein VH375_07685, partial [Rhodanobacteraceae bacterium]
MSNALRVIVLGVGSALAFAASAGNLIVNPDFNEGVDGWTTITAGNGTATLDTTKGSPAAPSIRMLAIPAASTVSVASSCMQIDGGSVDLYVNIDGTTGYAFTSINSYSDPNCVFGLRAEDSQSYPATQSWDTYSMTGVNLPPGTRSAKVVLAVTMGASGDAGNANFDHVQFGPSGTVPSNVNINQEGLSGTWYNPATSGQGIQLTFSPDDTTPGQGSLFGAWYTYDITAGQTDSQRWYSLEAGILGDADNVAVTIFQNIDGNFNAPPATSAVAIGSGTLTFDTCQTGTFSYAFDDGRSGTIPLQRLLPNVECVETGVPANPKSDFGLGGTWYNAATSGQGMLVEVNPVDGQAFLGWYTYAADGASSGAAGERWFSAQSPFT